MARSDRRARFGGVAWRGGGQHGHAASVGAPRGEYVRQPRQGERRRAGEVQSGLGSIVVLCDRSEHMIIW